MSFAGIVGAAPRFLDVRFDAAGRPLPCPGNTVLAHLGDGPAARALSAARDRLRAAGGERVLAFLPAESCHMTLFDGLLHDVRRPDRWPSDLPLDAPADRADAAMLAAFRGAPAPGRFTLSPVRLAIGDAGLGLILQGADAAEESRLRAFRDDLAARTGLRHRPGHDSYVFHITLAYLIAPVDPAEAEALETARRAAEAEILASLGPLTLGPPEACLFTDMTAFRTQFRIA